MTARPEHAAPSAHESERALDERDGSAGDGRKRIPLAEWVAAVLGLVLVVGAIAMLLADGLARDARQPDVIVHADSVAPSGSGYHLRFRAVNRGDLTAAALVIRGELAVSPGVAEVSEAQLDYLPGHSEREGGLFFEHDPRRGTLVLRATGYAKP